MRVGDQNFKINLWDTAGQERFRAIAPIYYKEARGAVLVYDITDKTSFERVVKWVKELKSMVGDITMVIAGNKCDREQHRQIDKNQAIAYATQVGARHFHTSAKTGKNVEEVFAALATDIMK
jgi:Ras-related protein Rab-21